jgi:hypothetical protein
MTPLTQQPLAESDDRAPGPHVDAGDVYVREDVEQQQLGELLGVEAVVLPLGAEDQPQLGGVGHRDVVGQRADGNRDSLVCCLEFKDDEEPRAVWKHRGRQRAEVRHRPSQGNR